MRNLLALVGAAILTFAGLGWYLGWYTLAAAPRADPGHQSLTIDIDAKKINADVRKGEQKLERALEHAAGEATGRTESAVTTPRKNSQ